MRKSFDGLMAIIRDKYELDPYANALYLFCGRDKRKIKALHFDKDGFVLLQKRLDGSGRFQWPTNASEARQLTRQQFRWLTEGLSTTESYSCRGQTKRLLVFMKNRESQKVFKIVSSPYGGLVPKSSLRNTPVYGQIELQCLSVAVVLSSDS